MASVQEQRWAQFVRKVAALRESTSLELLPDLMPVLPVVDPGSTELDVIRGRRRCMAQFNSPAVAARVAVVLLTPPQGSNILITIDRLSLFSATGATQVWMTWTAGATANVASAVTYFTDRRQVGSFPNISAPQMQVRTADADAAFASSPFAAYNAPVQTSGDMLQVEPRIVLTSGQQVYIYALNLQHDLRGSIEWSERTADPSELTPGY